jgi:hypothetical protein
LLLGFFLQEAMHRSPMESSYLNLRCGANLVSLGLCLCNTNNLVWLKDTANRIGYFLD